MKETSPTIFAIKRYAIHDGPNIRTTVFFKGCPLSCSWCHNPEGLSPAIEMISDFSKCIGCRECISSCQFEALTLENKVISKQEELCTKCYECLEICPALVFETTGYTTSVQELVNEIKKDIPFFDQSGGGVTFSGGEPLMQASALINLLKECGKLSIHRTVDTSGFAPTSIILEVAEHTDLFLIDLKLMDDTAHEKYTGVSNELILKNIRTLAENKAKITIRIPLIPGINDHEENIKSTAIFVSSLPSDITVEVLPYHSIASSKYNKLHMNYPGKDIPPSSKNDLQHTIALLNQYGLLAQKG